MRPVKYFSYHYTFVVALVCAQLLFTQPLAAEDNARDVRTGFFSGENTRSPSIPRDSSPNTKASPKGTSSFLNKYDTKFVSPDQKTSAGALSTQNISSKVPKEKLIQLSLHLETDTGGRFRESVKLLNEIALSPDLEVKEVILYRVLKSKDRYGADFRNRQVKSLRGYLEVVKYGSEEQLTNSNISFLGKLTPQQLQETRQAFKTRQQLKLRYYLKTISRHADLTSYGFNNVSERYSNQELDYLKLKRSPAWVFRTLNNTHQIQGKRDPRAMLELIRQSLASGKKSVNFNQQGKDGKKFAKQEVLKGNQQLSLAFSR